MKPLSFARGLFRRLTPVSSSFGFPIWLTSVAVVSITISAAAAPSPVAWFRADAITGIANGGTVQTWADSSANGNSATQATASKRPTYVTGGLNNLPVVHFNNANSTALNFNRVVQDDFTIACVFRSTQGIGSGTLFYQGAGLISGEVGGVVNDFGTCLFANGTICAGTGNPDVAALSSPNYNDGKAHLFEFIRVEATGLVSLYVDGTLAGTTTGSKASLTAPPQLTLGAIQTGNNFLTGDIAEVRVFNSALSDADRQSVEAALTSKYAISFPVVAPVAWFQANTLTNLANGTTVADWTDSSGNGNDATQATVANRPTFVTNAMHGQSVVRFNAANSTLLNFNRVVQNDFTIICVFQSTQGLGTGLLYYQGAGLVNAEVGGVVNDFGTCLFANGAIAAGTGNPDVAALSTSGFNDGNPHVMTFARTAATGAATLYMDGVFMGAVTGSTAALTSPANITIGALQTDINFLSGDISEVKVYSSVLADTNRVVQESQLIAKYGVLPSAPTGLYIQMQNGQAILHWIGSAGATNYNIKRSTNPNGPFGTNAIVGTSTNSTFTDPTSIGTNVFYYVVSAVNVNGESPNSTVATTLIPVNEPPGASSRRTPIVFSEIMYKPAPRSDTNNLEYIELYNSNPFFHDISGYQIVCADMSYKFPSNTVIPANGYFVVVASPGSIQNVYGLTSNVFGPYQGSLKKSETLQLSDEQGAVLLAVPYSSIFPWPVAALGTGHSLALTHPTYGEGDPRAWGISDTIGGSPGQTDTYHPNPLRKVVINELLPHSENPAVPQFIELFNDSSQSVDVSGCILTDDPATNKFVIPFGTIMGPNGFLAFTQSQFGFTLNGAGETLYFIQPDHARILDAVQFTAQADGVSYGRWPDGANDFYALNSRTPGTNNSAIAIGDIMINELMYNPISGNDDDQYIELYNQGTNTISLLNWQLSGAVTFTFPNVALAPNGYLVVARNETNLFAKYTNLNGANTVGNYGGKLSHSGEQLVLSAPQTLNTNTIIFAAEDQVTYGTGGRWGEWADGGGSSLELIDPRSNHRLAANWADSDESQKSSWTNIEFTGVLDNGQNYSGSAISYAQIALLDVGECLVDNVEVDDSAGNNCVANPSFESGLTNWTFQGSFIRSSLENSGYQSGHSLHVRTSDRYFIGDDSCELNLNANALAPNQTATLRFKARWIHGWPEAILRLNGGWLEAAGPLPVPTNLGTPGMPNSVLVADAGPAMYNVTHAPSLPAASQPAVVSLNVSAARGLQNVVLNYRIDPATNYTSVPMFDFGADGDLVAGDGVFSATIPGQPANTLVAYYISATNSNSVTTRFPALLTDGSPTRECLVMFGDGNLGGSFSAYHLWITQSNVVRWGALGNLSNEGIDCTMVNGTRVIYNAQAHFAGSPVHQYYDLPNGSLCSYKWIFNDDDKFLGATSYNKVHQPGNTPGDDASLQREQLANTFLRALGVPWLNRRYVVVYVNGNRRSYVMEDAQTPDSDNVKEHFPNDDGGFLYKVARWYEFTAFESGYSIADAQVAEAMIMPFTTTGGVKKLARYRWNFESRKTPDLVSDYTNVFSLIDAASSHGTANYVANMENIVDMENWMRVFAANHAAGNWDCFGSSSGQNLYAYIGTLGTKWSLLMFDFNIGLGINGSYGPGANLFTTVSGDSNMAAIFAEPTFRRMYWRALQELVNNGPLNVTNSGPLLDAKYAVFVTNGFSVEDPNTNLKPYLSAAQASIASQLAQVDAANFIANTNVSITNNLAYVTGTAPVNVASITINGINYPLTWTSLTSWAITLPLTAGTNVLNVAGLARNGTLIAGDTSVITAINPATNSSPAGQVVINEIMYAPPLAAAQFVELYNNSTNFAYDLSGWQLPALSYTFPAGSFIGPQSFLVLAQNRAAFVGAYGATNQVFDTFSGTLTPSDTLALVAPIANSSSNQIVAEVKYENNLPWPTNLSGGTSLQLIDAPLDNWRVANWVVGTGNGSATPGKTNSVAATLAPFQPLWINELEADNLSGITNSAGLRTAWLEVYNPTTNAVPLNGLYLTTNYLNLTNWAFPSNAVINSRQFKLIFADGLTNLSTTNELHTSFTLSSGAGSLALTRGGGQVLDYVNYTNLPLNTSYGSLPDGQSFNRQVFYTTTPGEANSSAVSQPPSFINYAMEGGVYSQNFDSLPNPGAASVNANNPVTINSTTYSLANPYDFAFPPATSGGTGGLGIPAMAGWYGLSKVAAQFGATDGDQTTGGDISFGASNSSSRALGLLATTSTGYTAFGAKLINNSGATLRFINLRATGEVWRQSDIAKTLQCFYFVDPTAALPFSIQSTASLPAMNVSLPTNPSDVNGVAVDGTQPSNQIALSITNQMITNWPSGAALWIVWEMASSAGKAQGLAIDDFNFSATEHLVANPPTLSGQTFSGNQIALSWPLAAAGFQLYYSTNLTPPVNWQPVTNVLSTNSSSFSVLLPTANNAGQYFRLMAP